MCSYFEKQECVISLKEVEAVFSNEKRLLRIHIFLRLCQFPVFSYTIIIPLYLLLYLDLYHTTLCNFA